MIIHDKVDVGSYAGAVVLYDGNADKDVEIEHIIKCVKEIIILFLCERVSV